MFLVTVVVVATGGPGHFVAGIFPVFSGENRIFVFDITADFERRTTLVDLVDFLPFQAGTLVANMNGCGREASLNLPRSTRALMFGYYK